MFFKLHYNSFKRSVKEEKLGSAPGGPAARAASYLFMPPAARNPFKKGFQAKNFKGY
jgi:hypothetical protein